MSHFKAILLFILWIVISYCAFSFYTLHIDFRLWSSNVRACCTLVSFLVPSLFYSLAYLEGDIKK